MRKHIKNTSTATVRFFFVCSVSLSPLGLTIHEVNLQQLKLSSRWNNSIHREMMVMMMWFGVWCGKGNAGSSNKSDLLFSTPRLRFHVNWDFYRTISVCTLLLSLLFFSLHYNKKLFSFSRDKAINFHNLQLTSRASGGVAVVKWEDEKMKGKVEKIQFILRKILLFLHRRH